MMRVRGLIYKGLSRLSPGACRPWCTICSTRARGMHTQLPVWERKRRSCGGCESAAATVGAATGAAVAAPATAATAAPPAPEAAAAAATAATATAATAPPAVVHPTHGKCGYWVGYGRDITLTNCVHARTTPRVGAQAPVLRAMRIRSCYCWSSEWSSNTSICNSCNCSTTSSTTTRPSSPPPCTYPAPRPCRKTTVAPKSSAPPSSGPSPRRSTSAWRQAGSRLYKDG